MEKYEAMETMFSANEGSVIRVYLRSGREKAGKIRKSDKTMVSLEGPNGEATFVVYRYIEMVCFDEKMKLPAKPGFK